MTLNTHSNIEKWKVDMKSTISEVSKICDERDQQLHFETSLCIMKIDHFRARAIDHLVLLFLGWGLRIIYNLDIVEK